MYTELGGMMEEVVFVYLKVLSQHSSGRTEKPRKYSAIRTSALTEILIKYFLNRKQKSFLVL
jgi:hypothetical protein